MYRNFKMIIGIGSDLANIATNYRGHLIVLAIDFESRVFTSILNSKKQRVERIPADTYAKSDGRPKEACSKALGTGLQMGIAWKEMQVTNLKTGQPMMSVEGSAAKRLEKITPKGYEAIIHVTLTDDYPWAQAFVVIEALPKEM